MIITILSRDKISQNIFKASIQNLKDFVLVGTNSNQDASTFAERWGYVMAQEQTKNVIVFHALKRSIYSVSKDWLPEPTADYPVELYVNSAAVIYTPTLFQQSYGMQLQVLKGDLSLLNIQAPS